MNTQTVPVPLPVGGLWQAAPFDEQPPGTTPYSMNVWGLDSSTGRERMGIRPSAITLGSLSGPVYAWCPLTYVASSVTHVGLSVTTTGGTFISDDAVTWTEHITTNPGSLTWPDQSTCAVFRGKLYQATSGSGTVRERDFVGGGEGALTVSGSGSVPTKCGVVIAHGNRLWLMADKDNPHVYYASGIGNAASWNHAGVTAADAFASTGSTGGILGEPIIAALSHTDNCLLIGGRDSIYAVFGNPRSQSVTKLSENVGPLMQSAWCKAEDGSTWMVTRKGLWMIPPGAGGKPQFASDAIPNELVNIRPEDGDRVAVAYDHRWPGIHIFIDYNSGTDKSFYFNLKRRAFFRQSFSSMPRLAATFPKIITDNNSSIVMFDGTSVKQFKRDPEGGGESAESRDSEIWIPIRLSGPDGEGILHSITAALGTSSANVNWAIYIGNSAEEAFNSSVAFTGTAWSYASGRYLNYWQHPMRRGTWAYVKVSDVSNNRWLIEDIVARIRPAGLRRVG